MLDPIRHIDPWSIKDMESLRDIVKLLLNIVEQQSDQLEQLRQENQELKDEINRLKGEQARPKFPKAKEGAARDISSEKKRRKKNRKKGKKKPNIRGKPSEGLLLCLNATSVRLSSRRSLAIARPFRGS